MYIDRIVRSDLDEPHEQLRGHESHIHYIRVMSRGIDKPVEPSTDASAAHRASKLT